MATEYAIINHRTYGVMDLSDDLPFFEHARKDLNWVQDKRLLTVAVMEAHDEVGIGPHSGDVYVRVRKYWEFVEGARPDQIEFTTDFDRVCARYPSPQYVWMYNARRNWGELLRLYKLRNPSSPS